MPFAIIAAAVNLRDAPDPDAPHTAGTVMISDIIEKIADADKPGWWRVRVVTPGVPQREGFIRSDLLKELPVQAPDPTINKEAFFSQIAFSAVSFGANRDFLYALATVESGVRNLPASAKRSAVGPFQFLPSTWAGLVARYGATTGIEQASIAYPGSQAVFAAIASSEALKALTTALNRVPIGTELYCAHLLGTAAAIALLSADKGRPVDVPLRVFYRPTLGDAFVDKILVDRI